MITPYGNLPNVLAASMSLAEQHEWLTRRHLFKVGASAAASLLWVQSDISNGIKTFGQQLAYGVDPERSMILAFAVSGSFRRGSVFLLQEGRPLTTVQAEVTTVRGSNARYCRAQFLGLHPGTAYTYRVELDGAAAGSGGFTTAPMRGQPFRFTAFGDQGTGTDAVAAVQRLRALSPRFHIFMGDLSYADETGLGGVGDAYNATAWDRWLTLNAPFTTFVPWMCAVGNHDMEPGFALHGYAGVLSRVALGGSSPLDVPLATTFRVGNVAFIGLDSNDVSYEIPANRGWTGGSQTRWLAQTLDAYRSQGSPVDFIVVYMHHPAYGTNLSHACEGGVREAWVPLFDRYTVDLVLSGHSHAYERTSPIRAGVPRTVTGGSHDSATATTYITAGGGGARAYPSFHHDGSARVVDGSGYHRELATWALPNRTGAHVTLCVDASTASSTSPATMHLRAIQLDGTLADELLLHRGAPVAAVSETRRDVALVGAGAAVVAGAGAATSLALRRRRLTAHDDDTSNGEATR